MLLEQSDKLIALARSRDPADRERLLMGVVALCERGSQDPAQRAGAQSLIDQVFMTLVSQTERDVRRQLAERIAGVDWAPKSLVDILVLDEIEIARPVIAASPLLGDADLIRLIVEATLEHQIEVARRPAISESAVEAILSRNEPPALAALAHNQTAHIAPDGMSRLVDSARRLPALRAPLSRHPKLTEALGARLYVWVGDALRASLVQRFQLDETALAAAIDVAVIEAKVQFLPRISPSDRFAGHEATNLILVEKLDGAGQLKPGYLLRCLAEGKLGLFEATLARLAGLGLADIQRALSSERPELLAMACMAADLDRGVFAAVLKRVRELNGGRPAEGANGTARALQIFTDLPVESAADNFRRTLAVI